MKKLFIRVDGFNTPSFRAGLLVFFLPQFFFLLPPLFSFELELRAGAGNLAFDHGLDSSLTAASAVFEPELFSLANLTFSGEYGDFSWNAGFDRGSIMRNRLFACIKADFDYFFMEAGPFIGLFNSPKLPLNPGISAALGVEYPGVVFVRAGGSSTLGAAIEIEDNYFQNSGDLSLGFWVPHVICSLNLAARNFIVRENPNLLVEDSSLRYFFAADVYSKNVPYTVRLDFIYQSLTRGYTSESFDGTDIVKESETDEFKSIILGIETRYTINASWAVFFGGELPVYSWGARPMRDPPKDTALYELYAGFAWSM